MRRLSTLTILIAALAFLCVSLLPDNSNAIPSFARKYQMNCSNCHLAWPQLNQMGRTFKENGYKFPGDAKTEVISDFLQWDKHIPLTAVIVSRPYDEKKSDVRKVRALHEVELMVAGLLYKNVSGFLEIEAEDEEDFEPEISTGVLGYHPMKALNIQLSYSPVLWADPYDTFSDKRKLTRGGYSVIDNPFGGADNEGTLANSRQTIALYGRSFEKLFYSVGFSGLADDAEGKNANNFHGRLAVDIIPEVTIGAFGITGKWDQDDIDRDFSRYGFDLQVDYSNVRLTGAYLHAKDDRDIAGNEDNDAWYAQAFYVWKKDVRPLLVPLVRFDSYEKSDGKDEYKELTLNLGYYFTENIKGFVEYWTQTDKPDDVMRDNRITLQVVATF
ncbi:MAG: hypothetical protein IBX72_07040 [Nitrospirae bacterium]|jgi:hypothetical protein|nr:hypothetical protein [Nitrospirota bacterium]